jgi:hypothetical protein
MPENTSNFESFVQRIIDATAGINTPEGYEQILNNLAGAYEVVMLEYQTKFPERASQTIIEEENG